MRRSATFALAFCAQLIYQPQREWSADAVTQPDYWTATAEFTCSKPGEVGEGGCLYPFQKSSAAWLELKSGNGIKFSNRHAHASCMYTPPGSSKRRMWVVGGKVEYYQRYDMVYSYKQADVWFSEDDPLDPQYTIGSNWAQVVTMTGDFYAQNADVVQPGKIAPWYHRFGHTLTPYDSNGDGIDDMMILMGGFAPQPMNDIWVTLDGYHWTYHLAPWAPRGWHSALVNSGKLYIMGGSPLNSEVWRLDSINTVNRTIEPLTRSSFSSYTYETTWTLVGVAPWSPRGGMSVVSQWYWNFTGDPALVKTRRDTPSTDPQYSPIDGNNAVKRMVLVGGFGGFLQEDPLGRWDGMVTRGDVWATVNGSHWELINKAAVPERAWFAMSVLHLDDNDKQDPSGNAGNLVPPRIWIFGGAYVGGYAASSAEQLGLKGLSDAWWSRDGANWVRVNYQAGAGFRGAYDTYVKFYSSQKWSNTLVNGKTLYLGLWGQTVERNNNSLILIAGDKTGGGTLTSTTFRSLNGLFCDVEGIACSNQGECGATQGHSGCVCNPGYTGEYCEKPCAGDGCKLWPPTG